MDPSEKRKGMTERLTPEQYAEWSEEWRRQRPHQKPPTEQQLANSMEMFDFRFEDLLGDPE